MSKKWIIIAGVILIAACSIGALLMWNYTKVIQEKNDIEKQRILSEERVKMEELYQKSEEERLKDERARANEDERQFNLDTCLDIAASDYQASWNGSCASRANEQETKFENCVDSRISYGASNSGADEYCRGVFPPLEYFDCSLPSHIYERWDRMLSDAKDACYLRYSK